jgi:hypothetical protein
VIARSSSSSPFTPRVGGDINGDGARNDAAFIFDPSHTADPALRAGMETVLASAPASVRACLERQLGEVAERNSCRGPWSYSLDLRATARPQVGPLGRRLSLSADLYNVPAGLDLLLHGGNDLRGWGQRVFQDDVLLYPRGFDPVAQEFRYEVNEAFGRRRPRGAGRSPFGLQLSARVSVGPERGAGFGGFGGGGMGGGMRVQMRGGPGGPGGPGGGGEVVTIGPDGAQGGAGGRGSMLERLLPEPISQILALGDSLGLSAEQTAALEAIRDSLVQKNEPIRKEISEVFSAGPIGDPGQLFSQIGSRVNQGRTHVQAALDAAKQTLTPEQWEKVPESVRNSVARSFQQRGGPRGEGGERQARPRGGRGGSERTRSGPEQPRAPLLAQLEARLPGRRVGRDEAHRDAIPERRRRGVAERHRGTHRRFLDLHLDALPLDVEHDGVEALALAPAQRPHLGDIDRGALERIRAARGAGHDLGQRGERLDCGPGRLRAAREGKQQIEHVAVGQAAQRRGAV